MADTPALSTVRDLKAPDASGRSFASMLVLRKLTPKTAANGNPYLSAELGDRTGSFNCTVFSDGPAFEVLRTAAEGAVVRVEGKVETYQGRLSPKLTRAAIVPPDQLTSPEVLANLVETAPEDAEAL
ncbi:MAG TPA: OB-fold nucleic acid binding domain-containing protein, partial [Opitutaceae bacterium]